MALWLKRLLGATSLATAVGTADYVFNDATLLRPLRTAWVGVQLIVDYKFNFDPENPGETHHRVATRVLNVCRSNGGLYIKFGQAISSMNHVLPAEYTTVFSVLHDRAPVVPYARVEKLFLAEFGKKPSEMFATFEQDAIASASIAQVHKAITFDGEHVAVKVQKPYIRKQIELDLLAYKTLLFCLEHIFDLPFYWTTDYTCRNLRLETNFQNEVRNSELCAENFKGQPEFYVPKVRHDLTSERIMTAEWIDGFKMTDKAALQRHGWSQKLAMQKFVELFARQIFLHGQVHADPHPGNILVRPMKGSRNPQLVLLDHGLYVHQSPEFMKQNRLLWKSMFLQDNATLKSICHGWGIRDSNLFASLTLMKPYTPTVHRGVTTREDMMRMQQQSKEKIRSILADSSLMPRELIFIGRNMNLVRFVNKALGSPVNRVSILASFAAKGSVFNHGHSARESLWTRAHVLWADVNFKTRLWGLSLAFFANQWWQYINAFFGRRALGFEERLDRQLAGNLRDQFGLEVAVDEPQPDF